METNWLGIVLCAVAGGIIGAFIGTNWSTWERVSNWFIKIWRKVR